MKALFVLPLLLAGLIPGRTNAAVLCVDPAALPTCFPTIQQAIDAAAPRDEIQIAAGTYEEILTIPPRSVLRLRGDGVQNTIVHSTPAAPTEPALLVQGRGTRIELSDLTLSTDLPHEGLVIVDGARAHLSRTAIKSAEVGVLVRRRARVTVEESTLAGNNSGMDIVFGSAVVRRSTIGPNAGVGILLGSFRLDGVPERLLVEDSTITGNITELNGGGIDARGQVCSITIRRSTITDNRGKLAGGINIDSCNTRIGSSIIAGNTVIEPFGEPDCREGGAQVRSLGFNLLGQADADECFDGGTVDPALVGVDAMLEPLADNGGPTKTHAISPASLAAGAIGIPKLCRPQDQRGEVRTPGPCDLGAFELP
jgi:hypothetical protein